MYVLSKLTLATLVGLVLISGCANQAPSSIKTPTPPVEEVENTETEVTDTEDTNETILSDEELAALVPISNDDQLPKEIGDCVTAEVKKKHFRLWGRDDPEMPIEEDGIGKEIIVRLTTGMFLYTGQIGDNFLASEYYARGAIVELCLLEFPTDCPPGDDRGKVYSLLDYRTGFKDDVVDSWHLCGGA